jgi:nicotinamidase/pyrazinamidase
MRALIVVDLQNDFMPGGPLGVPGADEIIETTNSMMAGFDLVIATQDWHPPNHGSFADNHAGHQAFELIDLNGLSQVLWPTHCVQGSPGAEFVSDLNTERFSVVVRKGMDPRVDSYSGFADNGHRNPSGLASLLRERGVDTVYICGVATDYCVRFTAQDAAAAEFDVFLIEDACRGVAAQPEDVPAALEALENAGVKFIRSADPSLRP